MKLSKSTKSLFLTLFNCEQFVSHKTLINIKQSRCNLQFLCSFDSWTISLFSVSLVQDVFLRSCHRSPHFVAIRGSEFPKQLLHFLLPHSPLVVSFSAALLSNHLDFLCLLTFWLCQPSLLYPPVSCLIIEVSVCLRGAPQYLLIKASVCVCLFISGCYSRRSPGALMRHKPPLPTEAYTVSCHCTSSHSKHCQNEVFVSFYLCCSWRASLVSQSFHIYCVYSHISFFWSFLSLSPPQFLRTPVKWKHARGCFPIKIYTFLFFFHPSFFILYAVHLHFHVVLCGPFSPVTPPHPESAEGIL